MVSFRWYFYTSVCLLEVAVVSLGLRVTSIFFFFLARNFAWYAGSVHSAPAPLPTACAEVGLSQRT